MRLTAVVVALLVSGCAGTQIDATQPLDRACSVSECFLEREVRDFEVLDPTTLVVYVGAQRCAFKVQLTGAFCDLTFAPQIFFRSGGEVITTTNVDVLAGPLQGVTGPRDLRVCSGDLKIGVDGGPFTEDSRTPTATGPTQPRSQCRLSSIASLTDDQVLELYVAHDKVAPPPPMGTGEIKVGEQKEEGNAAPPSPESTPAPTNAPTGG